LAGTSGGPRSGRSPVEAPMTSSADVAARLSSIVELQREILGVVADPERINALIVSRAPEITSAHGAIIELLHDEDLVCRAASGPASKYIGFHIVTEGSLSGHAIRERAVVRSNNAEMDPRVDGEAARKMDIRSMIIAPLLRGKGAIGVLNCYSRDIDAFSDLDVYAVELLAGITSAALVQAQELCERRAAERRYRLLFEKNVAGVFRSTIDGEILDCNDALVEYFGYDSRDEMLTKRTWELYRERSDREQLLALLQRDRVVRNVRLNFRKKDGSPMIGVMNISFATSDDGETQLLGTVVEEKG
jgi:PAS domain S-box-containing protein